MKACDLTTNITCIIVIYFFILNYMNEIGNIVIMTIWHKAYIRKDIEGDIIL